MMEIYNTYSKDRGTHSTFGYPNLNAFTHMDGNDRPAH